MLTSLLSIEETLVDNKYGVATVMSPRRIICKPKPDDTNLDTDATQEDTDKTQFIIPKTYKDNVNSTTPKRFTAQIDKSPEVYFTIPLKYKKCSSWGNNFRCDAKVKRRIDKAAQNALEKVTSANYTPNIQLEHDNQQKHSITEAIESAAEQTTKVIEQIVFAKQKSPIILIHGFRGAPLGLKSIQDELKKANYKVYCPEIPPFAGAKIESYTPRGYANYLASYIEKNQISHPILIGHSMGSIIAAATAMHCNELVNDKLILMSPISVKTPKPVASVSVLQNYVPNKLVSYVTTRFLAVNEDKDTFKQTIDITNQCSLDRPPNRSELTYATKFSTHYCVGDFAFKKNTLLLAGEKDRLIRASDTTKLAERLGAQTHFLSGTGHLHNYEKPVETAQAILNFLEFKN